MKRILVCASRISHVINFHLPYLKYFKEQGYIVDVASEGVTNDDLIDNCYDMRFVKNPLSAENLRTVSRLKKLMKENEYTVVYSNSTLAGAAAKMAVMQLGKGRPYFVHISHGYMFGVNGAKSAIYRTVEKMTSSASDALVVMNQEDYYLAKKYKLGKNLHYIYGMGLCTEKFPQISDELRAEVRERAGADESIKLLLCVGEFSERKNQELLIRAFEKIHKQHKNTVLAFAGSGKTENKCRLIVEQLELEKCVKFLGQTENINELYRSSDLLVACSKMEGLPFNVMEALYCGVPVAASDIKGHRDLLKNKSFSVLFKNDISSVCECISRVLSDEKLYNKMKNTAFLDERYFIENTEPALLGILDKDYMPSANVEAEEGAIK